MSRSSTPSPFRSLVPATPDPDRSPGAAPFRTKPLLPSSDDSSIFPGYGVATALPGPAMTTRAPATTRPGFRAIARRTARWIGLSTGISRVLPMGTTVHDDAFD